MKRETRTVAVLILLGMAILTSIGILVYASSHRKAPFITRLPKVDGTDFYMFRSYETERQDFVTLVANYFPLQDPYGGPNYFSLDSDALYEIMIDNNGDAQEDVTFQFQFQNEIRNITLPVGQETVSVALVNIGQITADDTASLNVMETFTVNVVRGDRRTGERASILNADTGESIFIKPVDNIGNKSIPDYEAYARSFIYNITIPDCPTTGRMFVGQRKDSFVVNLGETFDLVNYSDPLGAEDAEVDDLADKNVTSFILEVPINCLREDDPVIGGWTTASLRQARVLNPTPPDQLTERGRSSVEGGAWTQVSRLASPLVNELVIGLKDKDRFNASEPKDDGQFAVYVTNPTFPEILELLFGPAGVQAPNLFPRDDLVAVFLTGVSGLNQPVSIQASEMLRLHTDTPVVPATQQNRLGVIGGDNAGFPNGRRPGDDVVDIALRVVMGKLISLGLFGDPSQAPSGNLNFTDGAFIDASFFDTTFPYLRTPIPGSPNPDSPN